MEKKVQPATDDAELANMLAGMNNDQTNQAGGLQFEESPLPTPADNPAPADPATPTPDAAATPPADPTVAPAPAETPPEPAPVTYDASSTPPAADLPAPTPLVSGTQLDDIRKEALDSLRPLVDKLNLPPEEQFDTLLLVIRSTDDQSLLSQAFAAAKAIPDETRRAQALLDIIKEIDFFNSQAK